MEFRELIAEKVTALKPSGIRKFFDLLETMEDAISLGVGEPDFQTPWHIRDAGVYSLEKGFTKYTPNAGMMALRQEISGYMLRRFGLPVPELESAGGAFSFALGALPTALMICALQFMLFELDNGTIGGVLLQFLNAAVPP